MKHWFVSESVGYTVNCTNLTDEEISEALEFCIETGTDLSPIKPEIGLLPVE